MDEQQAQKLGEVLLDRRQALGLSMQNVADGAGVKKSTIMRLEQGVFPSPRPETLAAVADVLGLNLADVYTMAGYPIPGELPSPVPYLRTKYRDLSEAELRRLTQDVTQVLKRHGIDPSDGPLPGEDEQPEQREAKNPRTKKGGTP
jgi:transcriptional regulator with XRE-family HTH domain